MSWYPVSRAGAAGRVVGVLWPRRHWKLRLLLAACLLFLSGCAIVPVHAGGGLAVLISAVALALAACGGGGGGGGSTTGGEAPSFSVADASATEGDTEVTFTVTRGGGTTGQATVDYSTAAAGASAADSRFFTATSGTLTFASGETQKTVAVPLTLTDDDELQLRDPIGLTLSNPSAGSISDGSAAGVVVDNDNLIRLANWDGTFGTRLDGEAAGDTAGYAVNAAGDIDGDGSDDLVIGAPFNDTGASAAGKVYVVLGTPDGASAQLSGVGPSGALRGFTVTGDSSAGFWRIGSSVAGAGDISADGVYGDLLIGSAYADTTGSPFAESEAFAIYGSSAPASVTVTQGGGLPDRAVEYNSNYDQMAQRVSALGDFDGDGRADLLVGDARHGTTGAVGIVSGAQALSGENDLAQTGTNASWFGFLLTGTVSSGLLGEAVSAGDVDADGLGDALVGQPNGSSPGQAFLIFGDPDAFQAHDSLYFDYDCAVSGTIGNFGSGYSASCPPGFNVYMPEGITIVGGSSYERFGSSLATGDVNGDGHQDVIVGAPTYGPYDEGRAYVIFGDGTRTLGGLATVNGQIDLGTTPLDGSNGFTVTGTYYTNAYSAEYGDRVGSAVGAVDLNGDGADELVIGAEEATTDEACSGKVLVLWGRPDIGSAGNIDASAVTNLGDGVRVYASAGYSGEGCYGDYLGFAIARAGDINGDGLDDLLLGAPGYEGSGVPNADFGATYLIFGADIPLP